MKKIFCFIFFGCGDQNNISEKEISKLTEMYTNIDDARIRFEEKKNFDCMKKYLEEVSLFFKNFLPLLDKDITGKDNESANISRMLQNILSQLGFYEKSYTNLNIFKKEELDELKEIFERLKKEIEKMDKKIYEKMEISSKRERENTRYDNTTPAPKIEKEKL
jgi:hypothetical protein